MYSQVERIIILAGSPDPNLTTSDVQLTHEFDRKEALASLVDTLENTYHQHRNGERSSGGGAAGTALDQRRQGRNIDVSIERVPMPDWPKVLARLREVRSEMDQQQKHHQPHQQQQSVPRVLVFNLCDGTELDGYPGPTIIRDLDRNGFAFTGSDSDFYRVTTPKTLLKEHLQDAGVPTSEFVELTLDNLDEEVANAAKLLGFPMIVKPSISYASLGITSASVTWTAEETVAQARAALTECPSGGCFVEKYLAGREFTAFVSGDPADIDEEGDEETEGGNRANKARGLHVYPVAERVFKESLGEHERFLAFDKYWAGWTLDGERPDAEAAAEPYYAYHLAPAEWQERLQQVAREAYIACKGSGYGRVDMRTASLDNCDVFVLEVNANCGLTFDETSSLGEILRLAKVRPEELVSELLDQSLSRWKRLHARAPASHMGSDAHYVAESTTTRPPVAAKMRLACGGSCAAETKCGSPGCARNEYNAQIQREPLGAESS